MTIAATGPYEPGGTVMLAPAPRALADAFVWTFARAACCSGGAARVAGGGGAHPRVGEAPKGARTKSWAVLIATVTPTHWAGSALRAAGQVRP